MHEKAEEYFDPEDLAQHPAWLRLNDQLDWYDKKSGDNQRRYKQIKVAQLVPAGSIPVFALASNTWGRWITAILGASVAILEGLQQLGQYNNPESISKFIANSSLHVMKTVSVNAERMRHVGCDRHRTAEVATQLPK